MSTPHDSKLAMIKHDLVPAVLSENVDFKYNVKIQWPETTLETPGQELGREQTQAQPKVFLDPAVRRQLTHLGSSPIPSYTC